MIGRINRKKINVDSHLYAVRRGFYPNHRSKGNCVHDFKGIKRKQRQEAMMREKLYASDVGTKPIQECRYCGQVKVA